MKQVIRKTLVILLYIGLITLSTKVYATTGKIEKDTVRVRKETSTDSEILTLVSVGDEVEILSEEGEWYKIKFEGNTGYIRKDMLAVENEVKTEETNTSNIEENEHNEEKSSEEVAQTQAQENANEITIGFKGNIDGSLDLKLVPIITSSTVSRVDENSEITVTDIINKWAYIESKETSGWILLSKINIKENSNETENEEKVEENKTETSEKEEENETQSVNKYVSAESLNVRKTPENNGDIINNLKINTQVTVTEVVDSTWSKITYNGKQGYVASKYLSDKKVDISSRSEEKSRTSTTETESTNTEKEETKKTQAEDTASNSSNNASTSSSSSGVTGSDVVAYAKQFLGYKYVYGGSSPSGFDCSGFTSYVYKHFGYSLNRTSSGQRSNGIAVDKSNLKAGDILCFTGHVGMYIGGGSFIHASNPSGGVKISNLSESYYQSRYITARRIIY